MSSLDSNGCYSSGGRDHCRAGKGAAVAGTPKEHFDSADVVVATLSLQAGVSVPLQREVPVRRAPVSLCVYVCSR